MPADQRFQQLVAAFLAEVLRSRHTTVTRAAEISRRVVAELEGLQGEPAALAFVSELERQFEEVTSLKQALHFGYGPADVRVYERELKDFAADLASRDPAGAARFLEDAASRGATVQDICLRYPDFCTFLLTSSDKADVLARLPAIP